MRYNDEARMSNDETSSNAPMTNVRTAALLLSSALRHSFDIRHSTFVICLAFGAAPILADPPPSATDIPASGRMTASRLQIDLQCHLRQTDVVVPRRLR